MIQVAKISPEKASEITGIYYSDNAIYNPIQDANDNWIISLFCASFLNENEYEVIEYEPKVEEETE